MRSSKVCAEAVSGRPWWNPATEKVIKTKSGYKNKTNWVTVCLSTVCLPVWSWGWSLHRGWRSQCNTWPAARCGDICFTCNQSVSRNEWFNSIKNRPKTKTHLNEDCLTWRTQWPCQLEGVGHWSPSQCHRLPPCGQHRAVQKRAGENEGRGRAEKRERERVSQQVNRWRFQIMWQQTLFLVSYSRGRRKEHPSKMQPSTWRKTGFGKTN